MFSPNGSLVAAGNYEGAIFVWNVSNKTLIKEISAAHSRSITGLAFSHDNRYLISSSTDGNLRVWSIENNYTQVSQIISSSSVTCVACSPNNIGVADSIGNVNLYQLK